VKYGFHQKKEPLTLFWRFGHRMGKNRHRTFGATTAGASLKSVSLSSSTSPPLDGNGMQIARWWHHAHNVASASWTIYEMNWD